MDETLTPSLPPNHPNRAPLNKIQMEDVPLSYKDITIGTIQTPTSSLGVDLSNNNQETENANSINLTEEDKQRLYVPWSLSIIIKAVKMKFNHQ